ncbi:MAG: ferritin-like domain-containing protein [Chitinophagaceae bacterium]
MNFSNILSAIAEVDPEVFERTSARRPIIRKWMKGAALTAIPLALGGLFNKAYGKKTDAISDILNFALTLEYLERDFYQLALNASIGSPAANDPLIPPGLDQQAIIEIGGHELKHVRFLIQTLTSMGVTPISKPTFDFTANNTFPNIFSDYPTFLAVAQVFEDTGVRAYKGAMPLLVGNSLLTTALQIHSTEGRHAAHIRTTRRDTPSNLNTGTITPWVVGVQTNISGSIGVSSYIGEDNTLQNNIQITGINGLQITEDAATASFDEPLDATSVTAIIAPFIVP